MLSFPVDIVHSDYKNISIRAGSADNELEHRAIVQLLEKTFGDRFPIKGAYDPQFWKSHIGSRFVSLLGISSDKQIVGHLAYAPDRQFSGHVQILFPFCDCSKEDRAECLTKEFGQKAWQAIYSQALRQSWHSVYFFASSDSKSMQIFAEEVMQASCVAILPYYLGEQSHILVFERVLNTVEISQSKFFFPFRHREMLGELAENIKCDFGGEELAALRSSAALPRPSQQSENGLGLDRTYYSQTEVAHIFLKPGTLAESYFSEADLRLDKSRTSYLFVDCCDPACPELCEKLENMGLHFCGFFPYLGGQHNLVFAEHSKHQKSPVFRGLTASSAKSLSRYIQGGTKQPIGPNRQQSKDAHL